MTRSEALMAAGRFRRGLRNSTGASEEKGAQPEHSRGKCACIWQCYYPLSPSFLLPSSTPNQPAGAQDDQEAEEQRAVSGRAVPATLHRLCGLSKDASTWTGLISSRGAGKGGKRTVKRGPPPLEVVYRCSTAAAAHSYRHQYALLPCCLPSLLQQQAWQGPGELQV